MVGPGLVHRDVTKLIEPCRAKVRELYEVLVEIAGPFELPEPTEQQLELFHSCIDWEALGAKKEPESKPDRWMSDREKAEIAEAEERWKAEIRAPRTESVTTRSC